MSACCYIVPSQQPTVVSFAKTGVLTANDALNLVLAKGNRLQLLLVLPDGLKPLQEITVPGKVAALCTLRRKGDTRDSLLVVTCKYHIAVLYWDDNGKVRTRASGCVAERIGRPSETGIVATVHSSSLIGLRLYDGGIKIVQWEEGKDLQTFTARLEDMFIWDIQFLHPNSEAEAPRLMYIYQDTRGRHLKIVQLCLLDKDVKVLSSQLNIESEATMIVPVWRKGGGAIVLGQETIMLCREDGTFLSASPPQMEHTQFLAWSRIDNNGQRFLIGDLSGCLSVLLLGYSDDGLTAVDMKVEYVGESSIPCCLAYVDNGVFYVGSAYGDSQLMRLQDKKLPNSSGYIKVIESFPNLGPIRDMALVESDGLSHLITCSGAYKDGSLRVIRNGIGIEEFGSVEILTIRGLFPLRIASPEFDDYLIVSFVGKTQIFAVNDEELEETDLPGLILTEKTVWAGIMPGGGILQITKTGIRLVMGEDTPPVVWNKPKDVKFEITGASVIPETQQIICVSGCDLMYLEIENNEIVLKKKAQMKHEIASVDIFQPEKGEKAVMSVVGLWDEISAVLLAIPDFNEVSRVDLPGDIIPRTVMLQKMEETIYLLVSMGDGDLHYFVVDPDGIAIREPKKACLGTVPTELRRFNTGNGQISIFACSDRPVVIFSQGGKLVFSNVNIGKVYQMCSLNSKSYEDCLVYADLKKLTIGKMDAIQKLHIKSVPLGESVSRITHQPETNTIAILTYREEGSVRMSASRQAMQTSSSRTTAAMTEKESADRETHSLVIMDSNSFEILHSHELRANEQGASVLSAKLGNDPTPYIIVGTAITSPDEAEPKQGRVLVFESGCGEHRSALRLVHEKELKGAALSLASLSNKLVIAVNSSVRLFEWTVDKELKLECSHFNYVTALYTKTKGDMLLVGDLMRSLCLVAYKSIENAFDEIARSRRDTVARWITAVEIMKKLSGETYLGAESSFNFVAVERETFTAESGEERQKLTETGAYYVGDMVNTIRRGTLVCNRTATTVPVVSSVLFGTVDGSIGQILQLEPVFFKFLQEIEKAVAEQTSNCMRVPHFSYRAYATDRQVTPKHGFVDGDLVESLLDMPRAEALEIVKACRMPSESKEAVDPEHEKKIDPEEVLKVIEELARLH